MNKVIIESTTEDSKNKLKLYGGNKDAFKSREKFTILVGAAGTGKTYALCLKMHFFAVKYPGVKILLCRKSLPALRNSVVKTYQDILSDFGFGEKVRTLGETRPTAFIYDYSENTVDGVVYKGISEITLSQIDTKGKALGAQYDMIYVNQPDTEGLTEDEFMQLASRARLENAPYRQILADPNPASDTHWLLKGTFNQEETGEPKWRFFSSIHQDNPRLFNHKTNEWTELGEEHLKQLELLPKHLRESQLKGNWFSSSGSVFGDYWDPDKHVTYLESPEAVRLGISKLDKELGEYVNSVPKEWEHYLAIDFGFNDPFVAILCAKHPYLDKMIVHKHIYITKADIYRVAEMTANMVSNYNLQAVIADRGRAETTVLENYLDFEITTTKKGNNSVLETVNLMISEFNSDRWIFLNTDESLQHEKDALLEKARKPMGLEEIPNLRKDEEKGTIAPKQDDHFTDALRYLMRYYVEEVNRPNEPEMVWL